jgi:hypothetical protein
MKFGKILGHRLLILLIVAAIGIPATIGLRRLLGPRARPITSSTYGRTPQRLERGLHRVCHSPHD